jgi:hypothetical protein
MKPDESTDPMQDLASQVVKQLAVGNMIRIELSEEQLQAILDQWDDPDPRMAAEITFYVGNRPAAGLRVAGYRYRGNTCCV